MTLPTRVHMSTEIKNHEPNLMVFIKKNYPNELPSKEEKALRCKVPLEGGQESVEIVSLGNHIFINEHQEGKGGHYFYGYGLVWDTSQYRDPDMPEVVDVEPFVSVKVVGESYHKKVTKTKRRRTNNNANPYSWSYGWEEFTVTEDDSYNTQGNWHHEVPDDALFNYLKLAIIENDGTTHAAEVKYQRPAWGDIDLDQAQGLDHIKVTCDFYGNEIRWSLDVSRMDSYSRDSWSEFQALLRDYNVKQSTEQAIQYLFDNWLVGSGLAAKPDTKGILSVEKKKDIAPNLEKLKAEEPTLHALFQFLHNSKVTGGVSNNQLLSAWLKADGTDYNKMVKSLRKVLNAIPKLKSIEKIGGSRNIYGREVCLMFDEAKKKDEEKRSHKEWYLKKNLGDQATGLGCDAKTCPKTHAAIAAGDIPINVFHNPGDKLHLINGEFELWEKGLKRGWGPVLFEIAKDASRHSTYEKDITPYISFLFKIEKYLDRHTGKGKKWRASPKYVQSQWDLEMEAANESGTVKRRSALTPLADNENRTVEVPFAAIAISGRQTTYCYSKCYYVFEEGMIDPESGSPVVNELEKKLNNRDDYGLMYYTLNGTPRNRGYPTFLIIFERLSKKTRVHFHRVHPNKSKEGRPTPAFKLVEECYRYMAGNVRAEEIYRQQGDLIFMRVEEPKHNDDALKGIADFESHAFVVPKGKEPVRLLPNEAKSIKNRLGHLFASTEFTVDHPEHEPLKKMPSGWYEVRRCKSWEANPQAVWSFTID